MRRRLSSSGCGSIKTLTIAGGEIHNIPTLYAELNRVFMAEEDWTLGQSLDAFHDMLGGAYGIIKGRERVRLVWTNISASRSALGIDATRDHLREKLRHPELFNAAAIGVRLEALERGSGKTYFETVIDIIADHHNIELVPS